MGCCETRNSKKNLFKDHPIPYSLCIKTFQTYNKKSNFDYNVILKSFETIAFINSEYLSGSIIIILLYSPSLRKYMLFL